MVFVDSRGRPKRTGLVRPSVSRYGLVACFGVGPMRVQGVDFDRSGRGAAEEAIYYCDNWLMEKFVEVR
jgi:hypothetical protein